MTESAKKEVELKESIFVYCPKEKFALTRCVKCKDCDHYQGMIQVSKSGNQVTDYRLFCGHPITRQLVEVIT